MNKKLFLFAGEASGDLHGEALLRALSTLRPDLHFFGVGGPRMRSFGLDPLLPMERFQVMGFLDVFLALPRIVRSFYFLARKILSENPAAVVFIDYPGFSLRLERHLKKKGYKGAIIHYICPSVWAHGKQRVALMEENLDLLLAIFPFETRCFSPSFPVHYVGHPLVERLTSYSHHPLTWSEKKKVISLFPGSRKKEIERNLPLQLKALKYILDKDPETIGAISLSDPRFLDLIQKHLDRTGLTLGKRLHLVPSSQNYDLMASSYFSLAKSGTVTLELALHKVPTVVTYPVHPIDLFIARRILRIDLPFYCIVNIVGNQEVFRELIGPYATVDNLILEVSRLLDDSSYREKKVKDCQKLLSLLTTTIPSSQRAAELICSKCIATHDDKTTIPSF